MRNLMFILIGTLALFSLIGHTSCTTTTFTITTDDNKVMNYRKRSILQKDNSAIYIVDSKDEGGYYMAQDGNLYPYHQLPHDITESDVPRSITNE